MCNLPQSTAVTYTDVTRDDRKVHVTTITRALRPQWECYLTKQTCGVGLKWPANCGNGESRKVQACTRHLAASVFTTSEVDHPHRWLTRQALSNSRLAAVYLWLAIAKAVSRCPGPLKLFDVAKMRVGGIKHLQSFERRWEWRDVTRDILAVGIGFHTRTLPAPPPLVFV